MIDRYGRLPALYGQPPEHALKGDHDQNARLTLAAHIIWRAFGMMLLVGIIASFISFFVF